ncbi:hypothetical protein L1887_42859 [Cichorium endivia]|nr:hypothetical protein L1887_42859 [Cichorium endivia]
MVCGTHSSAFGLVQQCGPNADLLLGVAVVQRDGARQRQRPDRRIETGVIKQTFPAFCFAVEASGDQANVHAPAEKCAPRAGSGYRRSDRWISHPLPRGRGQRSAPASGRLLAVISASSCGASTVPRTFTRPFRRAAQTRQGVVQIRRVDGGVQIEIFHPQLTFDIRRVAAQRHVQAPG